MKSVFVKSAFISSLLALVISSSFHAATERRTTLVIGNGSMGDTTEVAMAKRPPTPDKSSFTSPTIGAEFVLIPAGTFTMGDSSDAYKVKISRPFYMQTTEVTQVQWQKVIGEQSIAFHGMRRRLPRGTGLLE